MIDIKQLTDEEKLGLVCLFFARLPGGNKRKPNQQSLP